MKRIFLFILLLKLSFLQAQPTPRQLYPGLFEAVQLSGIFPDNKTFVDATALKSPAVIMIQYNQQKNDRDFNLKQFVLSNFLMPGANNNGFHSNIEAGIRSHIDTLWQVLQRRADSVSKFSSLLPLPHPYIVPGGRFREIYYWDSYFTMLGLQQSHHIVLIHHMIDNFSFLIDKYGFIPNGTRSYYLSRSQPPFFSLMVNLLAKSSGNAIYAKYQPELLKEYNYWMRGAAGLTANGAAERVVRMPGHEILNRYWDESDQPREESYVKDVDASKNTKQSLPEFYHNVRAAAASGWDFSSRWFDASARLETIQTARLVPVDLNCLLYNLEITIARSYQVQHNYKKYQFYNNKAIQRKKAIIKYCWDAKAGWFDDYNWVLKKQSNIKTLAAVFPLEFKIASAMQANKIESGLKINFLKPGGLVTTLNTTGQQWDAPNGWAPLQYMAIDGLNNYKFNGTAKDIAQRWVQLNVRVFNQTGKLLEKYNVVDTHLIAGGGEYPLQDGFGWTNGVLLTLMNKYNFNLVTPVPVN